MSGKSIIIYTDGSCNRKSKLGGIGVIMSYKSQLFKLSKGYSHTTSPRMELRAVIEALKNVEVTNIPVRIFSDNQYACYTWSKKWYKSWEEVSFYGIANKDLIKEYLEQFRRFSNITIEWIRGHNGNELNEEADRLANYKQFQTYIEDVR